MSTSNINSIQNKFEELVTNYKEDWRSHNIHQRKQRLTQVIQTLNSQFLGIHFIERTEKKGGGGIMALISSSLVNKRIKNRQDSQKHWN